MNELEQRCFQFAKAVRDFCTSQKKDVVNLVYIKQLIRSSSSIGANYIEANEKLGKQDLLMHLKISRKEAKESLYWLSLIISEDEKTRIDLKQEANKLSKIFSSIINKISQNNIYS